jgi:predicted O-methyltransferase YrrM
MRNLKILHDFNEMLGKKLNVNFVRPFPRHSVRFAKSYFNNRPITVVEIGTYKGENALNMLKELNVKKLYVIDPYQSYEEYKKRDSETSEKGLPKMYQDTQKKLRKYRDKVIFIRKFSDDAVKEIPEADFIYIDGNHDYEYVKRDIDNYFPKVKSNGILAGHDIVNKKFNKDILRALFEFSSKTKIIPTISRTDWWIVKDDK